MKKFFTVALTTVMTVLITLFVLWKLDVIFLNVPALTQSEVKENNKKNLTQLLGLGYPRIGDELQSAYNLYSEVAFESSDQIDFLIGDHETLYVHFEQKQGLDLIDQLSLYVSGNVDQIHRLGEKMLPVGSEFVSEDYTETEDRNETFRYTNMKHEHQYIYEYGGEDQYAVISISYKESDLLSEPEPVDFISKKLEVSFINRSQIGDVGATDVIRSTQMHEEKTSERAGMENKGVSNELDSEKAGLNEEFYDMESEFVGSDKAPYVDDEFNQGSFSPEAIQANNELLKDPEFLSYAVRGEIKGIDVPLGAPNGPYIENVIGQPDWIEGAEGGFILMYESYHAGFGIGYDYKEFPGMGFGSIYLPIELSYDQMIQYLGKPDEDGINELNGARYLFYQLSEYKLWVEALDESSEIFTSIALAYRN